jgi:ferric-dicitrate binding protein FerR (iron transport regulator)
VIISGRMIKSCVLMNKLRKNNFEDLILDETFREYIQGSNDKSVSFWNNWINEHPGQADEVRKAKTILITLLGNRKAEVNADKEESLKRLMKEINKIPRQGGLKLNFSSFWMRAASVIILAIAFAWIWQMISANRKIPAQKIVFNEIIVPVGEKAQAILSDGTHVWINSGSRFKYPVAFGQNSRDVSLQGEAYFDVKKRGKSTFTVSTHDVRIVVLGTAFNVKAYPEDLKTQTTVVRGLVRVESREKGIDPVLIRPNQMAVLKSSIPDETNKLKPIKSLNIENQVNTVVITSWKDQMLVFADESFGDIAIKMERWFNTKIRIEDARLKQERYTGKFVHNETVYEVLEAIKLTTPIEYTVKNEEIVIKRK